MSMKIESQNDFGKLFAFVYWPLATIVGWILGYLFFSILPRDFLMKSMIQNFAATMFWSNVLLTFGLGIFVGAFQEFIIRKTFLRTVWWTVATALGLSIGAAINIIFIGAGVGIFQWLLLRQRVDKAWWWIFICAIVWVLGYGIGTSIGFKIESEIGNPVLARAIGSAISGIIVGFTGGITLFRLSKQRRLQVSENLI
ncbi:MAG: hypothetical protein CVU44_07795 [Chloroflexi bacterium HGW-Chloroflexi-6]|nr:MAG: hypothetical protein CVU44_07795 [Chloroflexi bacterium HGW-Chloroflexi-6]